jgi:D-sedoheptulose 7-phosphate isomerase
MAGGPLVGSVWSVGSGVFLVGRTPLCGLLAIKSGHAVSFPSRERRKLRAGYERSTPAGSLETCQKANRPRTGWLVGGRVGVRASRVEGRTHIEALASALTRLSAEVGRLETWGSELAVRLSAGARLLAVGNGGSAAEAQHLTAELVGRYREERRPLSALCLHAETSSLTAIANDYGADEAFARQVQAHGRTGDVLIALSTSGRSSNVLAAVDAANTLGITTWCLCGPAPNPLSALCDDAICLDADAPTVQELQLVAIHLLCAAVDAAIAAAGEPAEAVQPHS